MSRFGWFSLVGGALLIIVPLAIAFSRGDDDDQAPSTTSNTSTTTQAPAVDPEVVEAAHQIEDEAAQGATAEPGPRDYAEAATRYVLTHVRPDAFSALIEEGQPLPADAGEALRLGAGLCGNATEVLIRVLAELGIRARPVLMFFPVDGVTTSHVAAEAFWDGTWHYLDPTYGGIFESDGRVLSVDELLGTSDLKPLLVDLGSGEEGIPPEGLDTELSYLAAADGGDVAVPPQATLAPVAEPDPEGGVKFDLADYPDTIGQVDSYGGVSLRYQWNIASDGATELVVDPADTTCGPDAVLAARAPDGRETSSPIAELGTEESTMALPPASAVVLSVQSQQAPCYLRLEAISVR